MDKALLRNIPKVDELLAPTHALCPDASAAAVTAGRKRPRSVRSSTQPASCSIRISAAPV